MLSNHLWRKGCEKEVAGRQKQNGKKRAEAGPKQTLLWLPQLLRLHFLLPLTPVSHCIFIIPNSILTSAARCRRGTEAPGAPEVTKSCVIVG